MRVLWLSHLLPFPLTAGVMQRSYHLLRQAARRHEVHFVGLAQGATHPTPEAREAAVTELSRFCARVTAFPIPADRSRLHWTAMAATSFFRQTAYEVNWLRSASLMQRLRQTATRLCFDLVHTDTAGLVQYLPAVPNVPRVLNHHNVESAMMRQRAERETSPLKRIYLRREAEKLVRLERQECPRAAVNLVVSDLDGSRLRNTVGPVAIETVPNGVDVEYFRPSSRRAAGARGVVFAGGMSWYPNREAMLYFLRELWPALRAADPSQTAVIVGSHPPAELLAAAADDPRLTVPGLVPDIRPYLERAAVYVCPIRNGGGTRLKILDALAMATPLVATRFAVEGIGLREGEHFLPAESADEFVQQIQRLQREPSLRRRIAAAGRRFVEEHYSWEMVGESLEHAYQRALERSRSSYLSVVN